MRLRARAARAELRLGLLQFEVDGDSGSGGGGGSTTLGFRTCGEEKAKGRGVSVSFFYYSSTYYKKGKF